MDGKAGPESPKVLWVYKAQEHFIASPVVDGKLLYAPAMGAFNTGVFHALSTDPAAADRAAWTKGAPFLKLPMVCAPSVAEGLMVFGDGMHQTDGATLYCLGAATGRPVWQLPLPGKLIHLEGSPAIVDGAVFTGGGDAGVLCADMKHITLEGKEQDLSAIQAIVEKRWTELQEKYQQDKVKDPEFAIPPSEDALPKPAPKLLWQKGQNVWHVDAPVAVAGGKVLAASARIEEDKVGKCCLVCLNAADGTTLWETPLKLNPWAGASLAGNTVLVGCSSIRFDRKLIPQAKGSVVALDLATGQIKWEKEFPGGVLGPVAVAGDLAVFTATDGKVRALAIADGAEKWTYAGAAPFFAAPAVAGNVAYAADLKAVLHAINLADGKAAWTLDVAADPAVQSPGMVFGSPIVAGGMIYLGTCNIEGENADRPCAVVCVADKSVAGPARTGTPLVIDRQARTITIPAKIAPRKLPTLKDVYPLEVVATLPAPLGQKAHETIITFDATPSDVHKALEEMGLKPGTPAVGEGTQAIGPELKLFLELPGVTDRKRLLPLEKAMVDSRTGKPLPPLKWIFTGSALRQPDPDKPAKVYGADLSGTLISIFPVTDETVFQSNLTMKECALLKLDTNKNVLPEEGAAVRLVIQVP